ncbi:MAG: class I SAM-dependent methyltransferase [Erysipelotrichaceae bacterium]|nr:class I SAM-dependent methyltransferase [Erysipelotrichaceae bacterium]
MDKYHIENNTIQETLIIPLYARAVCSRYYPDLLFDEEAEKICGSLDYDFAIKGKAMETLAGRFGAIEVAQCHYDLICEINEYLKDHPYASVVNLGCGLDDTFSKVDNGMCHGYNIDFEDVIKIREKILGTKEREENLAYDLNDERWMKHIVKDNGVIFFASGVFYYLKSEEVRTMIRKMAEVFPSSVLVFDCCNRLGVQMMTKTWLSKAGISDVGAYFYLDDPLVIEKWDEKIESVSAKSYMRGYRDIYDEVDFFYKLMIGFCDRLVKMKIVKIFFR